MGRADSLEKAQAHNRVDGLTGFFTDEISQAKPIQAVFASGWVFI